MAKLKHLPEAYYRLARIVLGIDKATQEEVERLSECYKCNQGKEKCPECGCPVQAIVLVPKEKCPRGLWKQ